MKKRMLLPLNFSICPDFCGIKDCSGKIDSHHLCRKHLHVLRRGMKVNLKKRCKKSKGCWIENCNGFISAHHLCKKHYMVIKLNYCPIYRARQLDYDRKAVVKERRRSLFLSSLSTKALMTEVGWR